MFVIEMPKTYIMKQTKGVDLFGLVKEELEISINDTILSIAVNTNELIGFRKRYKGYRETFIVSRDHDLTKIEAKLINGLLSLKIPLKENLKEKQFQIKIN
jgi:HSP20 family molecular chaperone IbpA